MKIEWCCQGMKSSIESGGIVSISNNELTMDLGGAFLQYIRKIKRCRHCGARIEISKRDLEEGSRS